MVLSRRDFITVTGKGLAAVALGNSIAGCASGIQRNFPEWHGRDYEFQNRTEAEEPYRLERAAIFGKEFYVQRVSGREGELPFIFLPFDKTRRVINTNTNRVRLESDENYIPRRVRVEDYTEDQWADELDLVTTYSPETGIEGIRADILSLDELRRRAGASRNSPGFSEVTTERDARYGIMRVNFFDEAFFFPHVEIGKEKNPRALDFYLVPVEGSEIVIRNSDGRITIRNENNIYRAILLQNEGEREESPSQTERIRGD